MLNRTQSTPGGKTRNYLHILLAVLFFYGLLLNSALAGDKIKIELHQPPPNKLGIGDMWNLELDNTSGKDMEIYLTGTATEEKDGLIVEGRSKPFIIKPGKTNYSYKDFANAEVKYNNGRYKEIILRTGYVPEGNYTICVTAFEKSGEVAGQENCIMQKVIMKTEAQINLVSPADGAELDPENQISFAWVPFSGSEEYTLKIVEINGNQSPDAAMKENRVFFEKKNIKGLTIHYPTTAQKFDEDKTYAWEVESRGVFSYVWSFRRRPRPVSFCKDFKVDFVKNVTGIGGRHSSCCYDINITNNYSGAYTPNSFKIFTNKANIITPAGNPTGWSQTASILPLNVSNIVWIRTAGPIPVGTTNLASVCFGNVTADPFYIKYEWISKEGILLCKDSVKIECKESKRCVGFLTSYKLQELSYNNYFTVLKVDFTTSTPFSSVTATVLGAKSISTGQNLAVEIEEAYVNSLPASQPFSGRIWKSISPDNNCDLKLLISFEPKPALNNNEFISFQIRYSFFDDKCNSCDTMIEYIYDRYQSVENLYERSNNPYSLPSIINPTAGGNLLVPCVWEPNEHANITKSVLEEWGWTNYDAIFQVCAANACTDLANINSLFKDIQCSLTPDICEDFNCVKVVLSRCPFNQYPPPHEWSRQGDLNSHGLHFDNCFTYSDIEKRWLDIDNWVHREGKMLQDSARYGVCDIHYWICLMGVVFHAVQDFYCHSNWVLLNSIYGANYSLDADQIPTWEEIHGSWGDPWLSNHPLFDKSNAENNMKYSNYKSVRREFKRRKDSFKPNGGLQTGRWGDYSAENTSVKPWGHRHPGKGIGMTQFTPRRKHKINKHYVDEDAFSREYFAAMGLSYRATRWWLSFFSNPNVIGIECAKQLDEYVYHNQLHPWPDFGVFRSDTDEDTNDEDEDICVCNEQAVKCREVQYLNNGEFLLKFSIQKQNVNQLSVTMLDAETEMTNFDPSLMNLNGQVWSNISSDFSLPGFTLTSMNNNREVVWDNNVPAGVNFHFNSQLEIVAKFRQPVNTNENLSFCLGFEFLSGNRLCRQTVSFNIKDYNTDLNGTVENPNIEIY